MLLRLLLVFGYGVLVLCNRPPVLVKSIDLAVVQENTPIGTEVFQLVGLDPENATVTYGLEGTDNFKVDPKTGLIVVSDLIDREKNDSLKFFVTLEDIVGSGQDNNLVKIPVTVIVIDTNDNVPVFENLPYEISIKENVTPGSTVLHGIRVTDADDVGGVLEVYCRVLQQFPDSCDKFSIVMDSVGSQHSEASLVLRKPVSYSEKQNFQLLLEASDGQHVTNATVEVTIEDVQNRPPVFYGSLTAIIDEDATVGTLVVKVLAKDGDLGNLRNVVYELVSNPEEFFSIDRFSGEIRTAKRLDRELFASANGVVNVAVKAIEVEKDGTLPILGNSVEWSTTAVLSVTIRDVNDEPPSFNKVSYTVHVNENVADGTPLPNLDMFIQDTDSGSNSVFNIELMDDSNIFSVEPHLATSSTSVSIRIANGPLDYENPNQRKFILLVVAKEAFTNPQLSSTGTVTVNIVDTNDNVPKFDKPEYKALVLETSPPGTVVDTITATDRDTGAFGESGIIYSLFGNGAERFQVGALSGVITVSACPTPGSGNCLDYETRSAYYLSYQAVDENGRGQAAVVPLTITLSDANDNAPAFIQDSYSAIIDEGSVKFDAPLRVQAVDADSTSVLLYSIIAGNERGLFTIDGRSGEISVTQPNGLDVSSLKTNMITLTVQARDEGKGNVTTTVVITVKDANNNAPQFEKQNYVAVVSESALPGDVVEQVSASDADTGVNANITYRIQRGGFDDFYINFVSGIVTVGTKAKLDYDRRSEYFLEVIATDAGSPPHTGTATLTVHILNSNDKAPYFTPSTQRTQVTEGEAIGHVFYKLQATDKDISSAEALSFAVAPGLISAIDKDGRPLPDGPAPYQDFFNIDSSTGEVRVSSRLDREMAAIVTMTVLAIDNSATPQQTGTGTLVITIVDLNDYPPTFSRPWTPERPEISIHVMEEQPTGSVVATLVATDQDSNIAAYAIEPENSYFAIANNSGVISVKSRVDYESVKAIEFRVVAYDTGTPQLSAIALVTANVLNINDNDPMFEKSSYQVTVPENSPQGTIVTVVAATDADDGDFGRVQYSLLGEKSLDFNVDQKGVIRVAAAATLDREVTPTVTLQVVATDQAEDPNTRRSTSVPVYITLTDVNDNAPTFSHREYVGTVVAGLPLSPPTTAVQLFAEDKDEDDNYSIIQFSIIDGNEKGIFEINSNSGIIFPVRELEEGIKSYTLHVQAKNIDGDPLQQDEAVVHIQVVEINQEKPKFIVPALPNATVEIPENQSTENYVVLVVSAEDRDRAENGHVSYFLKDGDTNVEETNEFKINPVSGELCTKTILDREKVPKYQLVLVARDNGSPVAFESLRFLTVLLTDVNDNSPEFMRSQNTNPYVFTLDENLPINYAIGQVTAEDKDVGENSRIFYYIIDGNYGGLFKIEKTSGIIKSNASFDREERSIFEIVVKASEDPDFTVYERPEEQGFSAAQRSYREEDKSLALVRIIIADVNDNIPKFEREFYLSGLRSTTQAGDSILTVSARDADEGINGMLDYYLENVQLYRPGVPGSVRPVPSPFNVTADGHLVATQLMSRFDHARFVLTIAARELARPHRSARAIAKLWIYEPSQLVRIIISQPPEEVNKKKNLVHEILSNATGGSVVVDDIRYHVNQKNSIVRKWTDLFVHVVNDQDDMMLVPQVLEAVDSNSELLTIHQNNLQIHKIVPAYADLLHEEFDLALMALISLSVVIFIGIITMIVCCMCLQKWYSSRLHETLVKHDEDAGGCNTTENPLWTEQKLKLYEEQELSMTVATDHHTESRQRQLLAEIAASEGDADSAMYATLRKSTDGSRLGTFRQQQPVNDYATLNGCFSRAEEVDESVRVQDAQSSDQSNPEMHEYHELQCRQETQNDRDSAEPSSFISSNNTEQPLSSLTVNNQGEPMLITELL